MVDMFFGDLFICYEIDLTDDMTETEIKAAWREWMWNHAEPLGLYTEGLRNIH